MFSKLFVSFALFLSLLMQDTDLVRQVMRKHPNGKPYVVLFFKSSTQELVKEEVYFSNGNLQWTGTYKNDLEDGKWVYYYENGRMKSEQYYTKGKENGTFTDYDASGRMVKQSQYSNGKLTRETKY